MFRKITSIFSKEKKAENLISSDLVAEAKKTPGGWVYKIEGNYAESEFTPPGAIVGAWQVDNVGQIIESSYKPNPNFRPDLKGKKFGNKEEYDSWCNERT